MERVVFGLILMGLLVSEAQQATVETRAKRSACQSTKACLSPFPMLEEFIAKDNIKGLFAASYDVVLDKLCGQKNALHACLDEAYCSDVEISYLGTGVRQTLDFICGDGRSKLLNQSKCFSRDSFESGFKLCSESLESKFTALAPLVQLQLQTNDVFCTEFTKYFKCVENEVENSCSETAADFVATLTAKVYQPLANQIGCHLIYD